MAKLPLTPQQLDVLAALRTTRRNIALVARAGCGKTSTILEMVDTIVDMQPRAETVVCAYNKPIAREVAEKLVERGHTNWRQVNAATVHSLGWGLVRFAFRLNNDNIQDKKVRNIIRLLQEREPLNQTLAQYGGQVDKLVHIAKQAAVGYFDDMPVGDDRTWTALADHFDVNGFERSEDLAAVVTEARRVYQMSCADTTQVDFDDMVLFPLIKRLAVKFPKDFVILDEAQDLSRARQALALKFVRPRTGRMVIVGDDRQAIYGFSGADAEALGRMTAQLDAITLPLSITWRCPKAVVREAQRIVPDIQAADAAPEGEVLQLDDFPLDLADGDAILCRNTAPLVTEAYALIRQGTACRVEGRAIGNGLIELAQRWKIKTISALMNRLEDYEARETAKLIAKDKEDRVEELQDRVETLRTIARACTAQGKKTLQDVVDAIQAMFADDVTGCVVLATYHRSKGREWNRVFLLEHAKRCPSKAAKQAWQIAQEKNLAYVAITRAKKTLAYVG